ncbi:MULTISPECIES: hypothetical protein [unclassified Vibrio]|uniref:hypothetical protein n=1 Tax=unclassified Vibrio TaxID=2614977 RepID=UPI00159DFAC2|nr:MULTISPECIES: hypothetical protein [unclassified Vibrio]NVN83231.1 hypothetical protein [Vibrio sp. Scap16]QLE91618.1 hypothetical protein FLM53_00350 [Vibrio sp. Scap24]
MIPGISGGLTNSGSMPIDAGGGSAGPSEATGTNSIGGIRNGSINFGGGPSSWLPWVAVIVGVMMWLKKS